MTLIARENVRALMDRAKMKDADLKRAADLNQSGMHDFFQRSSDVRMSTITKIAAGLRVPPYVLLLPPDKRDALQQLLDTVDKAGPEQARHVTAMIQTFLAHVEDVPRQLPAPESGKPEDQ